MSRCSVILTRCFQLRLSTLMWRRFTAELNKQQQNRIHIHWTNISESNLCILQISIFYLQIARRLKKRDNFSFMDTICIFAVQSNYSNIRETTFLIQTAEIQSNAVVFRESHVHSYTKSCIMICQTINTRFTKFPLYKMFEPFIMSKH